MGTVGFDFIFNYHRKFDLARVGSISTKQLLDQLELTDEGVPRSKQSDRRKYTFPYEHRLHYKNFKGEKSLLVRKLIAVHFL